MLTRDQCQKVIRAMKQDRPVAWPSEDELVREFVSTAKVMFGLDVGEADARLAVSRAKFRD